MSLRESVVADLEWVSAYWPDLAESRMPGTRRPWRQPDITAEQKELRDETARVERDERSPLALGASPAPVDVAVLDLMSDIVWDAFDLAETIAVEGGTGIPAPEAPSTAFADARPYLDFAARHLTEDLADWAYSTARRMMERVARTLAMVYDGQALEVVCPWCRGVTPDHPGGGAATWRVREMPGGMVGIVCENVCEPPSRDVGTWWGGHPVWPISDWDSLARRIQATEARAA